MGIIANALSFMGDSKKLPIAVVLVLLPTLAFVLSLVISGFPLDLFRIGLAVVNDLIFWVVITAVLFVLLKVIKGKGNYEIVSILNRTSLIFVLNFLLSIAFLVVLFLMVPGLFSVLSTAYSQEYTFLELSSSIAEIVPSFDAIFPLLILFAVILGIIVIAGIYLIYRIIADYKKGSKLKNFFILLLFVVIMFLINLFL